MLFVMGSHSRIFRGMAEVKRAHARRDHLHRAAVTVNSASVISPEAMAN
jgi:hypothetical protein